MPKLSFSDWLALFGIVAMFILVALDKAGKLKGPLPLVLLAFAALFTFPLILGNSWVINAPLGKVKIMRALFLVFIVGIVYLGMAMWMSADTIYEAFVRTSPTSETPTNPSVPASAVTTDGNVHHATITPPPGGWLNEWGTLTEPNVFRSVADVSTMIPYRSHFNLMLVYLAQDNTVDEQADTRIMKSSLFSIPDTPRLVMDTPINQEIMDYAVRDKPFGTVNIQMRVAFLILPLLVRAEQISQISDATRLGGSVLTINGFPLTVTKKRKSAAIREEIGALIRDGAKIRNRAPVYIGEAPPDIQSEWTAWTGNVEKFLRSNFDAAEVEKFRSFNETNVSLNAKIHGEISDLENLLDRIED